MVLPHTAGFVDPLHSTGIAFTLSGVEFLLSVFSSVSSKENQRDQLIKYQDKVFNELSLIDLLVSSSYSVRNQFELFIASAMLYFIASIRYEKSRLSGVIPDTFLCAGDRDIFNIAEKTHKELKNLSLSSINSKKIEKIREIIRKRIEPYNTVGLMEPGCSNMYSHTAVEL